MNFYTYRCFRVGNVVRRDDDWAEQQGHQASQDEHNEQQVQSPSVTVPGKIVKTKSFGLKHKQGTVHVTSRVKKGRSVKIRKAKSRHGRKKLTVSRAKHKSSRASR
jgi:ribosomal protein L15E